MSPRAPRPDHGMTYGSIDRNGSLIQGGYATSIVVDQAFVLDHLGQWRGRDLGTLTLPAFGDGWGLCSRTGASLNPGACGR